MLYENPNTLAHMECQMCAKEMSLSNYQMKLKQSNKFILLLCCGVSDFIHMFSMSFYWRTRTGNPIYLKFTYFRHASCLIIITFEYIFCSLFRQCIRIQLAGHKDRYEFCDKCMGCLKAVKLLLDEQLRTL